MRRRVPHGGFAILAVLPWAIALTGLAVAAIGWVGEGESSSGTAPPVRTADPAEVRTLRLALATATAENSALRSELDRLVGQGGASGARAAAVPGGAPAGGGTATGPGSTSDLSGRISEALSRAAVGDRESAKEGAVAMLEVLHGGPEAMEALRTAYLETADPKAKMMMLPTMLFGGGEAARDFIAEQARTETDPELRAALIRQAAGFATPKYAEELKDTFLQTASSEESPDLRAAAIRGLRYAKGPEVQDALLAAASDPSEDIRLAAIENLASRPALRNQLSEMIADDPSGRVREVGECRLLLAESAR